MTPLSLNKILISLLLILLSSCGSKSDQVNENFKKKYGLEVQKINTRRAKEKEYADTQSKLNINPQIQKDFLPNSEALRRLSPIPDDMFTIKYYSYNFPDSYGKPKLSFDDIQIPDQDAFGVTTELGEKNYQLIDDKTLQKDVDLVRNGKEKYDDEVSLSLIREEKEKKRKEYLDKQTKEKSEVKEKSEAKEKLEEKVQDKSEEIKSVDVENKEKKNEDNQTKNTNQTTE